MAAPNSDITQDREDLRFNMEPVCPLKKENIFFYYNATSGLPPNESVPFHTATCLKQALIKAAKQDKNWVLDTRYYLNPKALPEISTRLARRDKLTVFSVKPQPHLGTETKTTNLRDYHNRYGGLYYIGDRLKKLLQVTQEIPGFTSDDPNDMFDWPGQSRLWRYEAIEATSRRFPYPVHILCSPYDDTTAAQKLETTVNSLLWGDPYVRVVHTKYSIYESHKQVSYSHPTQQSILFLDADFVPNENFKYLPEVMPQEEKYVHLWYVHSACNLNVYGHGGPKLINKSAFEIPFNGGDMTTSIGAGLTIHTDVLGTHQYNWSEESAWRTGFREAFKLQTLICKPNQNTQLLKEAQDRLSKWLTTSNLMAHHTATQKGAMAGKKAANNSFVHAVNDYDWLHTQYLRYVEGENDKSL